MFTRLIHFFLDPKYEEEVSGCTASVGIISKNKIYVVCPLVLDFQTFANWSRQTLVIHEVC